MAETFDEEALYDRYALTPNGTSRRLAVEAIREAHAAGRDAERECCARVADEYNEKEEEDHRIVGSTIIWYARTIAAAIRRRTDA